jgi:predicted Zn-dependent protease
MIGRSQSSAFQILGQGDEGAVLASARTLRPLTDAGRLAAAPARVKIVSAPKAGPFQTVIGGLGAQGVSLDQLAILNGVELGDPVKAGQPLKTVTPARLR